MSLQGANSYSNMMNEPMCYSSDQVRCYGTSERELSELEKEVNRMVTNGESVCLVEKSKEAPSLSQKKVNIVDPKKESRRKGVAPHQKGREVSGESRADSDPCIPVYIIAGIFFLFGGVLAAANS